MASYPSESRLEQSEPPAPGHSLPSYSEPTPESTRPISREDEAELALKHTVFSRGAALILIAGFILTICLVPAIQLFAELRAGSRHTNMPAPDAPRMPPDGPKNGAAVSRSNPWNTLPTARALKSVEKRIEDQSVVSQWLLPRVQSVLTGALGAGNEQTYVGRDGCLFYRPDVDYITGAPFLDKQRMKQRSAKSGVSPDPLRAIIEFRNQLASRGIELVVMPAPVKPAVDGEMLSAQVTPGAVLENASFAEFKSCLEKEGVRVFDAAPLLRERKRSLGGKPLYLQTDTHWLPETMEFTAERLAVFINLPTHAASVGLRVLDKQIDGMGDIATMLRLSAGQTNFPPQQVNMHQVTLDTGLWRPDKDSDVLLLGDSFSNIFSLEPMGWGESAGFAEHLSRALGRNAIDCILRNSDGAFSTRELLSQSLARGRDRLAGKKLVIWEFAARELAFGNWKLIPMKAGESKPSTSLALKPGEEVLATGTVEETSPVPRPGAVPYKDHIFSVHLVDIEHAGQREVSGAHALVYLWSMRNNVWTPAARLRPGARIALRLRSWDDVSATYEKFNRSEIDNSDLQKEEPLWGELVQ